MEEESSPITSSQQYLSESSKIKRDPPIDFEQRLMKQIEEQTQENLAKITYYNNAISKEIKGIDTRLDQIIINLQQDFYMSYQTWIKHKAKEFKESIQYYREKKEQSAIFEIKNRELNQKLQYEDQKRLEVLKQKDKLEQDIQNLKRFIDKLKDDIISYKQQAIEDRRKLMVVEGQNQLLEEQINQLKGKLRDEKHQSSIILLNNSTLQNQQSLMFGSDQIENQGNQTKFKAFLDSIFQNDLRAPEIKQELLSYFNTLELGYRDRIFKLQQKLKEAVGKDEIPSQSKINPKQSSILIEKPQQIESQKNVHQQSPRIQGYQNRGNLKVRMSRNQQARNKSQMVTSSLINNQHHGKELNLGQLQSSHNMMQSNNPFTGEDKAFLENRFHQRSIQKNYYNHSNLIAGTITSRHLYQDVKDRSPSTNNVFPKLDIGQNEREEGEKPDPLASFRSRLTKFNERKFTNSALRGSKQTDAIRKLEIK